MKKKELLRSLCFLLIVIVMLFSMASLLRDRESTLRSYYSEPNNTISTIFVGGSHVNSSYAPSMLWREYGIAAHNVYSWNQPIWTSYSYIKEALRTQSPEVVVVDLFGMMYGYSYMSVGAIDDVNYKNAFSFRMGPILYEMMWNTYQASSDALPFSDYLNLSRYHARWKYLTAQDFSFDYTDYHDIFKGYSIQTEVKPVAPPGFRLATETHRPNETCIEYLDKIVKLADQRGFQLVFTMLPYDFNETERKIFLWLDEYAQEHGIPLLNYNLTDGERIGFDFQTDMVDWGHTNHDGATKVTMDIGRFLLENYDLPLREEVANHEQRDMDAFGFGRVEKANIMLLETDPAQYLDMAVSDPYYTTYIMINNPAALPEEIQEMLGISPDETDPVLYVFNGTDTASGSALKEIVQTTGLYTITANAASGNLSMKVGEKEYWAPGTAIGILIVDNWSLEPVSYASMPANDMTELVHMEFTLAERDKVKDK